MKGERKMQNSQVHNVNSRITRLTKILLPLLALGTISTLAMPAAHAATATRSSGFVYDASGMLVKEIIEPGDPQQCLVTEYGYDDFGNKQTVTTRNCNGSEGEAAAPAAGTDAVIETRTTTTYYTDATDNTGRFPLRTVNALQHSETRTFDPRFGGVTSLTGPNQIMTTWQYDSFGRKHLESRADGTWTTWDYALCSGCVVANVSYQVTITQSGYANPSYAYYDQLNRQLLTSHRNFANSDWIDENRVVYDGNGRVQYSYLPYDRGAVANSKYSTTYYDELGRVTSVLTPDNIWITPPVYNGLTTTVYNASGQYKITVKNSQGQVVSVTDTQNHNVAYHYDPFGNLTQTIDPLGNTTTLTYDTRGRKKTMSDPDMGYWQYFYDALGELKRQIDAKQQVTTMTYDKLGRITYRAEPDLNSTWTYDTAAHGIGKIATVSSDNGYSRTYSYDSLGRPSSVSAILDDPANPYVTSTSYDSNGRVWVQTYPTGFAVRNVYTGDSYLSQVVNNATSAVYWTANTMDAAGHLTEQTYGNLVVTDQAFNPATERLTSQTAGNGGNTVQSMSYPTYDALGNLKTRIDNITGLTENFDYDSLNRVITATDSGSVNSTTTFAYDALGNITCKSDISNCSSSAPNYTYNPSGAGSVRPHAVAQITGTINGVTNPTYSYDDNGNMQNGAGRTTTWTSFNMAYTITRGTSSDTFLYNPEHERIKDTEADGTITVSLSPRYDTGLHFEKNIRPTGVVEYEHFLYAGGILFGQFKEYATTAAPTTITSSNIRYFNKDHLGSIAVITDESGNVVERLSYDVFGKRRSPNGAADPNGLLTSTITEHGFTGHEHLDEVGLINMNGRIYDPLLGRFMSADPTIQSRSSLQSYDRYSYAWNNPLNGVDPSGFSWLGDRWHALTGTSWSSSRDQYVVPVAIVVAAYYTGGLVSNSAWATCTASGAEYGGIAASATMGATAGGLSGAIYGGTLDSTLNGAINGAVHGAITGGINSYYGQGMSADKFIAKVTANVALTRLQGGNVSMSFREALVTNLASAAWEAAKTETDRLKLLACASNGDERCTYNSEGLLNTGGTRGTIPYDGPQPSSSFLRRVLGYIGGTGMGREGYGPGEPDGHWYSEDSLYGRLIDRVSKIHDYFNECTYNDHGLRVQGDLWSEAGVNLYSFAGMPIAAAITAKAIQADY